MSAPFLLRSAYWRDSTAKAAFCALAAEAFGLDFTAWDSSGNWDDDFRPFTYFDSADRAVANVCIYSMRLVVEGSPVRAAQVSTVFTRPDLRRKGLGRALMQEALSWSAATGHSFTFLFADTAARGFYQALGFKPATEHRFALQLAAPPALHNGARRLDLAQEADRTLLLRLAAARTPVSQRLGALNERLLMFHALGPHRADAVHVPAFDLVVFRRHSGGTLTLFDLVGREIPPLAAFLPFMASPDTREVVFDFVPDRLGDLAPLGRYVVKPESESGLHLDGTALLPPLYRFPATARA